MMFELLIHNTIKQIDVKGIKQFTSYLLRTKCAVNSPTVLMMRELLIHNIIKKKTMRYETVPMFYSQQKQ